MIDLDDIALMFDRFELATNDPRWSSWALERFVETVLTENHATMTDLIRGFDLALRRHDVDLTPAVANFIRALSSTGFVICRDWWKQADWAWATDELIHGVSAARAYLLLCNIPPDQTKPAALLAILRALEGTCRFDEAVASLADDLGQPAVREELSKGRENGQATMVVDQLGGFINLGVPS